MIMADKIISLRKKNEWSQEDLARELNVSRQSVSKWEGAQAVPDLNKVVAMARLFGVSTDYLLKDELEQDIGAERLPEEVASGRGSVRRVSMEEAGRYLEVAGEAAKSISLGVAICIISTIFAMIPPVAGETGRFAFTEDQGGVFGAAILLLLVACAVGLFIRSGMRLSKFSYLEKETIETAYGVDGMTRERKQAFEHTHMMGMMTGIILCVVSAIPVLVSVVLDEENDLLIVCGVAIMLVIIAVGVYLIVRVSIIWGAFQRLLEEGDYTRASKRAANGAALTVYWALVTAAYLGYSFWTMRWDRSWIIWPVAGVLSVVVAKVAQLMDEKRLS